MSATAISLVANAIAIIGWLVLFKQALLIKRKDDIKRNVELTTVLIDEIYQLCRDYYSGDDEGHISYRSTLLKSKFVLLSHYLLILRNEGIKGDISAALTAYKMNCTGGFFETVDFKKQQEVPNWKSELASSSQELRFKIERSYFSWSKEKTKLTNPQSYFG